ncbi:hypothetical protein ACKLK4_27485 [Klebsiella pneumoniae]|uniref:hypothetical protein n=1 Tax=Klebsiella pneumoniae TaxID=573 RepID=UPI003B282F6B
MLKHLNFPDALCAEVDAIRGDESFTSWLAGAARMRLDSGKHDQLDRIEAMLKVLTDGHSAPVTPQEPPKKIWGGRPLKGPNNAPKKRQQAPRGGISPAQQVIIDLCNAAEGSEGLDQAIADELNRRGMLSPSGVEWTHRTIMNTRVRLRKRGLIS